MKNSTLNLGLGICSLALAGFSNVVLAQNTVSTKNDSLYVQNTTTKDSTNSTTNDVKTQIALLENDRQAYLEMYNVLIKQNPLDMKAITEIKEKIAAVDAKITFLKNGSVTTNDTTNTKTDTTNTTNDVKTQIALLEKERQMYLDKYNVLIKQTPIDTQAVTLVKKSILSIDAKIAFLKNGSVITNDTTNTKTDTTNTTNDVKTQIALLEKERQMYLEKYNVLVKQTPIDTQAVTLIKKSIQEIDAKIAFLNGNVIVDKIDSTRWTNDTKNSTVLINKTKFVWTVKDIREKFCFQLGGDSLFVKTGMTVCNLTDGFIEVENIKIQTVRDSLLMGKRTSAESAMYWRVGVDNGSTTNWSKPSVLNTATITGFNTAETKSTSLYPNPVNDNFGITGLKDIEQVNLYNVAGILVKQFTAQDNYSVNDVTSGMYIVEIKSGNATTTRERILIK